MSAQYTPTLSHPPRPVAVIHQHRHTLSATAGDPGTPDQVYVSNASPFATLEKRFARVLSVYGYKEKNGGSVGQPINNTDAAYVGWASNTTPDLLPAGGQLTYRSDDWPKDLTQLYAHGTPGDGIYIEWEEMETAS